MTDRSERSHRSGFVATSVGWLLVALVPVAACSGGSDGGSSTGGTSASSGSSSSSGASTSSSSGSSGASTSSGTSGTTSAPTCGDDPVDIELEPSFPPHEKDVYVVRGRVSLPEPIDASRVRFWFAQFLLQSSSGTPLGPTYKHGDLKVVRAAAGMKQSFSFEIRRVRGPVGGNWAYFLQAFADKNGDKLYGEGDYGGFYAGTVETSAPPWQATTFAMDATRTNCNVEFGIGDVVCYRSWGEPCATFKECRSLICVCNNGTGTDGGASCDPSTNLCQKPPQVDCAAECANKGGLAEEKMTTCLD